MKKISCSARTETVLKQDKNSGSTKAGHKWYRRMKSSTIPPAEVVRLATMRVLKYKLHLLKKQTPISVSRTQDRKEVKVRLLVLKP